MRGLRIGRIFGIDLRIDRSWIVIFVLLTWNLVTVFSAWHPRWSSLEAFAVGVTGSLLFFGCVVLHELAHAAVASGYGIPVRNITLFLFGGVSNIEQEPPSPSAEFFTAIVGPLMSIALGFCFLVLASLATPFLAPHATSPWTAAATAELGPISTLLVWLGPINIMIGAFNLIPGFPLDGGRVLRALLWQLTGDLRTATRWASATGQTIGWLMIGGGIAMSFGLKVPFFGSGFISGIWLALIGWFLHSAASQATVKLALDDALAGLRVEQLMQRHGPIATPGLSLAQLVNQQLIPGDDRAVPVVDGGRLVGLVSIADVRKVAPAQWPLTPIAVVMHPIETLCMATPDEPVITAFEELLRRDVEQLPVVVNGEIVGMLRRRDVARWLELAWRPDGSDTHQPGTSVRPSSGRPNPFHGPTPHHA